MATKKEYRVWIEIEEHDIESESYNNHVSDPEQVGPIFKDLESAEEYVSRLVNFSDGE